MLFGVPPGVVAGSVEPPLEAALVLVPVEPAVAPREAPASTGVIEGIFAADSATAPMSPMLDAALVAGRGVEGDRYFAGHGTFSPGGGTGRDLTLVDAAALEEAGVAFEESRRNIVVRGIDLDGLMGRRFMVGDAECVGRRRCEPCAHLQRLTRPGVLRALVHRGGLRADVVRSGEIRLGDEVRAL